MPTFALRAATLSFALISLTMIKPAEAAPKKAPYQPRVAVVTVTGNGVAKVRHKSGIESVLGQNQTLYPGDKITTDSSTVAQLMLPDGSLVRLGYNTEYRIEEAKVETGLIAWVFQLTRGTIRGLVEKSGPKKEAKFRVNTPTGTMGVRGTEFILEYAANSGVTNLYTIEGKISFGAQNCETKKNCVMVNTGQQASLQKGQKPEVKAFKLEDLASATGAAMKAAAKNALAGNGAKQSAATGSGAESIGDSAELSGRLSVVQGLSSVGKDPTLLDDAELKKAAAASSQQLQNLQDSLLNRSAAMHKLMDSAAAGGTYDDFLAVGEGVAKQAGNSALAGDSDHLFGLANTRKFEAAAGAVVAVQNAAASATTQQKAVTSSTSMSPDGLLAKLESQDNANAQKVISGSSSSGSATTDSTTAGMSQTATATSTSSSVATQVPTNTATSTSTSSSASTGADASANATADSGDNSSSDDSSTKKKKKKKKSQSSSDPDSDSSTLDSLGDWSATQSGGTATADAEGSGTASTNTQTSTQASTSTTSSSSSSTSCGSTSKSLGLDYVLCAIFGISTSNSGSSAFSFFGGKNSNSGSQSSVCYDYRRECTNQYLGCDTSRGKACKASITSVCKDVQVQVPCH